MTIDEAALTDELRAELDSKGASLQEAPIEQLDLPEAEARIIIQRMDEAENGKRFKSINQVQEEAKAYLAKQRKDG